MPIETRCCKIFPLLLGKTAVWYRLRASSQINEKLFRSCITFERPKLKPQILSKRGKNDVNSGFVEFLLPTFTWLSEIQSFKRQFPSEWLKFRIKKILHMHNCRKIEQCTFPKHRYFWTFWSDAWDSILLFYSVYTLKVCLFTFNCLC